MFTIIFTMMVLAGTIGFGIALVISILSWLLIGLMNLLEAISNRSGGNAK